MILPAFNLITTATDFFDDEAMREEVLRGSLTELLSADSDRRVTIGGRGVEPDGVWFKDRFACLILVLKNEPGLEGDPFLQSLAAYGNVIAQQEVSSSFPSHLRCCR